MEGEEIVAINVEVAVVALEAQEAGEEQPEKKQKKMATKGKVPEPVRGRGEEGVAEARARYQN